MEYNKWKDELVQDLIGMYNSDHPFRDIFEAFEKHGFSHRATKEKLRRLQRAGRIERRTIREPYDSGIVRNARRPWTDEEVDRLIFLWNNHTHPFIITEMRKLGRYANIVTKKIAELKAEGKISVHSRLDQEARNENDIEVIRLEKLKEQGINVDRKRVREILKKNRMLELWRMESNDV